jgi:hypothetical protein
MTEQTQSKPLSSLDLDEIEARAAALYEYATVADEEGQDALDQLTDTDVPALVAALRQERARVAELEAERAKYVGVEPTIAEEMAYLSRCLDAVHEACDRAVRQATRWEHPLPIPEWVDTVRQAADGATEPLGTRPALPWAHVMDDHDLGMFLDDLVSAAMGRWQSEPEVPDRQVLAAVEKACADWRTPGQGLRGDEPGAAS